MQQFGEFQFSYKLCATSRIFMQQFSEFQMTLTKIP